MRTDPIEQQQHVLKSVWRVNCKAEAGSRSSKNHKHVRYRGGTELNQNKTLKQGGAERIRERKIEPVQHRNPLRFASENKKSWSRFEGKIKTKTEVSLCCFECLNLVAWICSHLLLFAKIRVHIWVLGRKGCLKLKENFENGDVCDSDAVVPPPATAPEICFDWRRKGRYCEDVRKKNE
jgi:hypothetical protein